MAGGTDNWPVVDLADLLEVLDLAEIAPGRFRARNVVSTLPTTLGSQTLAQAVVAAERTVPQMAVQSLHGVFPRGGYVLGPVSLRPYPQSEIVRRGGRGTSAMLAQTVTFHRPFTVHDWLLLRCESPFAGAGRMYARIQIFTSAGELVASVDAHGLMRAHG